MGKECPRFRESPGLPVEFLGSYRSCQEHKAFMEDMVGGGLRWTCPHEAKWVSRSCLSGPGTSCNALCRGDT